MLCQHACNMCVMMLHPDLLHNVRVERICCCQVIGMQVIGNGFRGDVKKSLIMSNSLLEREQRFQVFQITDMLADKCLLLFPQTKGIFEMCAASQHRDRKRYVQLDWLRRIATRTPQKLRSSGSPTQH